MYVVSCSSCSIKWWESVSICHLILCAKYFYWYNELVTLYNKVNLLTIVNVLINMNEQYIYVLIFFVNVG